VFTGNFSVRKPAKIGPRKEPKLPDEESRPKTKPLFSGVVNRVDISAEDGPLKTSPIENRTESR